MVLQAVYIRADVGQNKIDIYIPAIYYTNFALEFKEMGHGRIYGGGGGWRGCIPPPKQKLYKKKSYSEILYSMV